MAGGLEEAGVGWGLVGDERGKERQAGCPLSLLPGPQQRSLNGPGSEQGMCQC